MIDFADGSTWVIARGWDLGGPGEKPGHCRSCDAPVLWLVSEKTGRRSPFNRDGTSHFSNCPQADSWRKRP